MNDTLELVAAALLPYAGQGGEAFLEASAKAVGEGMADRLRHVVQVVRRRLGHSRPDLASVEATLRDAVASGDTTIGELALLHQQLQVIGRSANISGGTFHGTVYNGADITVIGHANFG